MRRRWEDGPGTPQWTFMASIPGWAALPDTPAPASPGHPSASRAYGKQAVGSGPPSRRRKPLVSKQGEGTAGKGDIGVRKAMLNNDLKIPMFEI
jgi:hypothetical protein